MAISKSLTLVLFSREKFSVRFLRHGRNRDLSSEIGGFFPVAWPVLSSPRECKSVPGSFGVECECALAGSYLGEHGFGFDPGLQEAGDQLRGGAGGDAFAQ